MMCMSVRERDETTLASISIQQITVIKKNDEIKKQNLLSFLLSTAAAGGHHFMSLLLCLLIVGSIKLCLTYVDHGCGTIATNGTAC